MNPLPERIAEYLEKTGYPSEFRAAGVLAENDFFVQHSPYFIDYDENKGREFDILAFWADDELQNLDWVHVVECKKFESPQVVFSSPKRSRWDGPLLSRNRITPANAILPREFHREWSECLRSRWTERSGRAFVEPFKDTQGGNKLFGAVASAVKAALYMRKMQREHHIGFPNPDHFVSLYFPIVVLDAPLFEAFLSGSQIKVEEVPYLTAEFSYVSQAYPTEDPLGHPPSYGVDIVQMDSLRDYLSKVHVPFLKRLRAAMVPYFDTLFPVSRVS